jgi:hypothetical protein
MNYVPCSRRTFRLSLADRFGSQAREYFWWLNTLLQRLGREPALTLWEEAFRHYDETLVIQILSAGWQATDHAADAEGSFADALDELFREPVEGVTREAAQRLLENTPPFRQIRAHFPTLSMERQISTYETLHLFRDALATLAEALLDRYGKQGELIAYDALLELRPRHPEPRGSAADYLAKRAARYRTPPETPDVFTAGLEVEFVRASETEVVTRVVECEWARYYRERHPRVGYLLACALDNAAYRSVNDRLRLQRTSTLMEGGSVCDFRVYVATGPSDEGSQA